GGGTVGGHPLARRSLTAKLTRLAGFISVDGQTCQIGSTAGPAIASGGVPSSIHIKLPHKNFRYISAFTKQSKSSSLPTVQALHSFTIDEARSVETRNFGPKIRGLVRSRGNQFMPVFRWRDSWEPFRDLERQVDRLLEGLAFPFPV